MGEDSGVQSGGKYAARIYIISCTTGRGSCLPFGDDPLERIRATVVVAQREEPSRVDFE